MRQFRITYSIRNVKRVEIVEAYSNSIACKLLLSSIGPKDLEFCTIESIKMSKINTVLKRYSVFKNCELFKSAK